MDGITVSGSSTSANVVTLIVVAIIFGLVNAILKPIIQVLGCLFYIVTLGLIAFVVNALLFLLVDWIADLLRPSVPRGRLLVGLLGRDHRRPCELAHQPGHPRPQARRPSIET